ncbi:MAG: CsbD family protein [Candidatus Acidiferrales bacterium]
MKPGTKNEISGKVHEVKGELRQKVGQVTNNPELEIEGLSEKIAGKVQTKVGKAQKAGEKP